MINLIHLSDIHYTSNIPSEQGCVINGFIKDLKNQLRGLTLADTYLLISGDLVFSGNATNYSALKKELIDKIKEDIGISYDRMIFVAGNHDVDREYVQKKNLELKSFRTTITEHEFNDHVNPDFKESVLYKKFVPFEDFFRQITDEFEVDGFVRKIGDNIAILCVNTALCSFGGFDNINDIGDIRILNINTRKINEWIEDNDKENRLLIFLMHHPIEDLSNWSSSELKKILKTQKKALVLTGHTHDQDIESDQMTTSSIIYSHAPQLFCNNKGDILGYSIITIDDKNKEIQYIKYREWSNKRRTFVSGENFAERGIRTFNSKLNSLPESNNDFDYKRIASDLLNNASLITDNYIYVIRALEQLKSKASVDPVFVFDFLCQYIRKRTSIPSIEMSTKEIDWLRLDNDIKVIKSLPYDVQLALNILYRDCINDFKDIKKSIDFSGLSFQNVSFIGMTIRNTDFSQSFIQHSNMFYIEKLDLKSVFENCKFDNSFLDAANMTRCQFTSCSFTNTNMRWSNLYGASFTSCVFNGCNMVGTIMSELHTNNTSFKQCNLDGSEILNINSNGVTIFDECSFCFASIFLNNIIENKNINSVNCNWAGAETDIRYYERHGRIKRLLIYCKNIADKDQIKTFSGNTVQFSPQMKRQRYYSILKTFHDYCLPNSAFDETIEIQSFMRGNYADILD